MIKPTIEEALEWAKAYESREQATRRRVDFACRYPGKYEEAARLATRAANKILPPQNT